MVTVANEQVPHLVVRVFDDQRHGIERVSSLQTYGGMAQKVGQRSRLQHFQFLLLHAPHGFLVLLGIGQKLVQLCLRCRQPLLQGSNAICHGRGTPGAAKRLSR